MSAILDTWPVAVCLDALLLPSPPGALPLALARAAALGFTHVDLKAEVERPLEHLEALAEAGVVVSCAALGHGLPRGHTLDAADVASAREALALLRRQVADAALLGARWVSLAPGPAATGQGPRAAGRGARFAEGCELLADAAARRGMRLCVEAAPELAGPDAAGLGLLLDLGRCLDAGEDPAARVRQVGHRLEYVRLSGFLSPGLLGEVAGALRAIRYRGGIAVGVDAESADPVAAVRAGKALAEGLARELAGG